MSAYYIPGNVLDAEDAEIGKVEEVPVRTELTVNWSLICTNILMAYVVQRQEILFRSCPNFHFPCGDGEFIYDEYVESECMHIKVKK